MKEKQSFQVDYLYLDTSSCVRCQGTLQVLSEVLEVLTPALELAGFEVGLRTIEIDSIAQAKKYRFLASPTILLNGRDIFLRVDENDCASCSDLAGCSVTCRVFRFGQDAFEVPPKEILANVLLQAIFANSSEDITEEYQLPKNLVTFFEGRDKAKVFPLKRPTR